MIYFSVISKLLYPNDFKVPFSVLSSSIILIIDIRLTNIDIAKNIKGKIFPSFLILSLAFISSLYDSLFNLFWIYHFGLMNLVWSMLIPYFLLFFIISPYNSLYLSFSFSAFIFSILFVTSLTSDLYLSLFVNSFLAFDTFI